MSTIICATGRIDSGKSQFCDLLREEEKSSIGFESGALVTELANECNTYLHLERQKITDGDNFFRAFNQALERLHENHAKLLPESVAFNASDLLTHPEQFKRLSEYVEFIRVQPELLKQRITADNKDTYRPLLSWLGGYLVFKASPTVWFDEIGRRIKHFQPAPKLFTVNALRYPADEKTMRDFAAANGHQCIVIELQRAGTQEGTDVTEASRAGVHADVVIVNNGTLDQLRKVAHQLLKDAAKNKLEPTYSAVR